MISERIDREQVARRIATDSYVEYNHAQNHNGDYERCDLLSRWTMSNANLGDENRGLTSVRIRLRRT